ncbi:MAG: DUF3782 domain-containing protein [Thermoproteus sp.]
MSLSPRDKKRFLNALKEDEEFRLAIAALLGLTDLQNAVKELVKAVTALTYEVERIKERVESLERKIDRFERKLDALGARFGVISEAAFREGIGLLLREVGHSAERWTYFDQEGYVYGYPSQVEVDVLVGGGKTFLVEIKSSVTRGDLAAFAKKAQLYERVAGRKVDGKYLVAYYVGERDPEKFRQAAEALGIKIATPEELANA